MKRYGLLQLIICIALVVTVSPVSATDTSSNTEENVTAEAASASTSTATSETEVNDSITTSSDTVLEAPIASQKASSKKAIGPSTRANYDFFKEAQDLADLHATDVRTKVLAAVNNSSKKLGYLKGSKLEITIPNVVTIPEFYYPASNANVRFSGRVGLSAISFTNDNTVSITYQDNGASNGKITITRLKNERTNLVMNMNYGKEHVLRSYRKFAILGWTQVEDEIGIRGVSYGSLTMTFAEVAPELEVTPKEEVTRLQYGSTNSLNTSDYYTVKTSAGKVTAKFLTQPDTAVLGKAEATIELTDEYKQQKVVTVPFEVFDTLAAEAIPQTLVLGQATTPEALHKWVKDVTTLSGGAIESADYQVELVEPFTANAVGKTAVAIRVFSEKYYSDVELSVPVTVEMGTTIQLTNTNNQIIGGLTVNNGKLSLVDIDDTNGEQAVGNNIAIAIFNPQLDNPILNESTPSEAVQLAATDVIGSFKSLSIANDLPEGSVIKVANDGMKADTALLETYNDGEQLNPINNSRIHEQAIYYLYQNERFSPVEAAHLEVKTVPVKRLTTESEMDAKMAAFFLDKLPENVSLKGFSTYPNTAETGLQTGKMIIEEQLGKANSIRYEQTVTVDVDSGGISMKIPETMSFKDHTFNPNDTTVERASNDWQLDVDDTRMDSLKTNWHINLKVSGEQELDQYMTFVDENNNRSYLTENVTIYNQAKIANQPDKTSISWKADQGVLLHLPADNKLIASETYQSTLEWSLVLGEE